MNWSTELSFISKSDGVKLAYATLVNESKKDKNTLVFLTGYKETYEKYRSFLSDLHTKGGFNIFTFDHRNQGLSNDTPGTIYEKGFEDSSGRRICFVKDFESTYVEDTLQFLETIVKPTCTGVDSSICVVGHSMGGLIAARLAEKTGKSLFDGMVLSAPMISHKNVLDVGGLFDLELPIGLASSFGSLMVKMKQGATKVDGRDTNASKPTTELLSHCEEKRKAWNLLRAQRPNIVLGGASFQWATAALQIEDLTLADAEKIEIPTLIFMSEHDTFVYNSAISALAKKLIPDQTLLVGPVSNAYHELLQEKNEISVPILNSINEFASQQLSKQELGITDSVRSVVKTVPVTDSKLDTPPGCCCM